MSEANTPGKRRGFTLVEMLVVLMIMGLFVGLVRANMLPSERDLLRVEAERLAQILDLAADEARYTGKSMAWTAEESGYRFWRLGADSEWSALTGNDSLRARSLPQGMSVSELRVEAAGPQTLKRLEFPPGGASLAFVIELSLGAEHYAVAASPVGELRISPGRGKTYADMAPK